MRSIKIQRRNNMQINRLQPKQFGIVYFDSSPRNARIYVDGQLLIDPDTEESLRTPTKALLYEGRRNFTYVLEGHEDVSGYVDVYAGATVNIFRNLKPGISEEGWGEPEPQIWLSKPQEYGHIIANTNPGGADIYLDGNPVLDSSNKIAKAPSLILNVLKGLHTVTFAKDGFENMTFTVNVSNGYSEINAILNTINMRYPKMLSTSTISSNEYTQVPKYSPEIPFTRWVPMNYEKIGSLQEVTGDVVLTTYPAGATIELDGKTIIDVDTKEPIKTPATIALYMGLHNLKFKLQGYCDEFYAVYVSPASTQYVNRYFSTC